MYHWPTIKPNLSKNSEGTFDYKVRNCMESWYLEFTQAQVDTLDFFTNQGVEYFDETFKNSYAVKCSDTSYVMHPDGTIQSETTYSSEYKSLEEMIASE